MRSFWIRTVNLAAIVGILLTYHMVLSIYNSKDQVARLQAELERVEPKLQNDGRRSAPAEYQDGVYSGEAEGFGGPISLEVTITDGRIADIQILSAEGEDGAYFSMAENMIPTVLERQSPEVDTISGATFSSNGIRNAMKQALGKAGEK
ncbi:FMN-binding protein [Lachnospiraceae bacterium 48-42]